MWGYLIAFAALLPFVRSYFNGPMCKIKRDLSQKIVIVTGCNAGIGKETVRSLAEQGAIVVLANRSKQRTQELLDELLKKYGESKIFFLRLDLSDLNSVREFATEFKNRFQRLDLLVNNAGVMALPKRELTTQGLEMQFGTNHIGHFALTLALKPLLLKSPDARVINVSSLAHKNIVIWPGTGKIYWDDLNFDKIAYRPFVAYSQSKLANILFTKQLQKELDIETQGKGLKRIRCYSVHPGSVTTELQRYTWWLRGGFINYIFWKDALHGAQTQLYLCLEDNDKLIPGGYYADCALAKSSQASNDPANCERLWTVSLEILRKKGFNDLVQSN